MELFVRTESLPRRLCVAHQRILGKARTTADRRARASLVGNRAASDLAVLAVHTVRAEYHGKQVDFDPIFQWPKPVQQPHPPILMGGHGPTVLDRTLSHADGWIPGHVDGSFDGLGDRIKELRERAAALGKPMEVTLNLGRLDFVDRYADMNLDRVVYALPAVSTDSETRQFVSDVGRIAQEVEGASPAPA